MRTVLICLALFASGHASALEPLWPQHEKSPFVIEMEIPAPEDTQGGVVAADLNGDGRPDFLVTVPGHIAAYANDGSKLWVLKTPIWLAAKAEKNGLPGHHGPGIQAADVDLDGETEVLFLTNDSVIHAVSGKTGEEEWSALPRVPDDAERWEHLVIANFRGQGDRDLLLQATNRKGYRMGRYISAYSITDLAIGKLGGSEPTFVLNTHHHGDHTGGNAAFGEKAVIVAHENVRKRLSESRGNDQPLPKAALPEITYKAGLTVHFNGEAIEVVHFPSSHTDGDGAVFFKDSKVVHTGDLFFNGRFPYVDLGAGGSVQGAIKSITKLTSMIPADWQIIPGHGSNATLDDLKGYLKMLETTTSAVLARVAAGKSLAECQEAGVPAEYADWGAGFISADRWIETIYNSYKE